MYFSGFLSYQYTDPWNSRRLSVTEGPRTPSTNITDTLRVTSNPSFNGNDSGIVPDGSIGYHQGGVINAANETDFNQAGEIYDGPRDETRKKVRPGLQRKRISFKDEQEAMQAGLPREGQRAEALGYPPVETTSEAHISSHTENMQLHDGNGLQGSNNGSSILISCNTNQSSKVTSSTGVKVKSSSSDGSRKKNVPGRVKD